MKDLTLFSAPELGDSGTACLERVLASATRMASHELRHRARLVCDYADLPWVQGSDARLGQVFLNLLINAAHAIPEGRLQEHEVRVVARMREPGLVMVEVRDTGAGMAPDMVERIFDPFFTTKPHNLGTGLGLAICHRIVQGVGGRIEVESELGRGSVFRVLLRTGDPVEPPVRPLEPPSRPAPGRARILVVDDDATVLSSTALLLEDDNEVEIMTNARAALRRLQAGERFDVVLCDVMMPDMTGMEFHARLSEVLPELAEQVIFITGGAVTRTARDFLAQVPNARLDKPFDVQELLALIADRIGA
jgi:CheY-like chemotaxis protein